MFTFNNTHAPRAGRFLAALFAVAALAMTGCIENDIPYPRIQPNFTAFEVVNESQATTIDTVGRAITVYLNEEADISNVQLNRFALSPSGAVWNDSTTWFNGVDLSTPRDITVALYQEYTWRITAVQQIERYFTFDNQIGAASIEPEAHRVVAFINAAADIKKVHVNTIKLSGITSTMSPDLTDRTVDFTDPVAVTVTEFGRQTRWEIHVLPTDALVTTGDVDAWSNVAWLHGSAEAGKANGFEYRKAGDTEWIPVPAEWVTHEGGNFTARLIHLSPLTTYEARAISEGNEGLTVSFTTGATPTIPNGDFSQWWLNGKIWCPWAEGGVSWWDSGNRGATTLGDSNTTPSDDTPTGTGRAARLETRFVGLGPLGKLAAGNIFAGSYVRTDGTNGILDFGRPWTERPTRLRGQLKYKTAPISSVSDGFQQLRGEPDTCIVWVALFDAPKPFEIRTNPRDRHLFDPAADDVIAYGNFQLGSTVDNYIPFEVTLDYKTTSRVPTYMVVVASASKYGDYFTGGNGAVLYITDLTLDYDY